MWNRALLLAVLLLAMPSLASFNCSSETCTINLSSSRWTCSYVDCLAMPNFLNVTNVTVYNVTQNITYVTNSTTVTTVVNLTTISCDNASFFSGVYQRLDNVTAEIRCSPKLANCTESRNSLFDQFVSCNDRVEVYRSGYVLKNESDVQIQSLQSVVAGKEREGWLRLFGGAAGATVILYYFFIRKPSLDQKTVQPARGSVAFDTGKLDEQDKLLTHEQKIRELEQKLQEVKPRERKVKEAKSKKPISRKQQRGVGSAWQ